MVAGLAPVTCVLITQGTYPRPANLQTAMQELDYSPESSEGAATAGGAVAGFEFLGALRLALR